MLDEGYNLLSKPDLAFGAREKGGHRRSGDISFL